MRIVLIGPPGAGKGTQSARLMRAYCIPHVSTGDLLREEARQSSAKGRLIQQLLLHGRLVSDDIMLPLVERRLRQADCASGFLLDGFPRTLSQADALQSYLDERKNPLSAAIEIQVSDEELAHRLATRSRADDRPGVIEERIAIYRQQAQPLLDYYERRRLLRSVDGNGSTDEVFQRLIGATGQVPCGGTVDVCR